MGNSLVCEDGTTVLSKEASGRGENLTSYFNYMVTDL